MATVLVIDSNSAVQAITTLALNQTECTVETLADGAQAYQRIRTLKPSVVLCAKELTGVDPFELCKRIKSESRQTAFVLLAPADAVQQTSTKAEEAQYDEVIYKPFKSNRLREVVTALMQRSVDVSAHAPMFYVGIQDGLRKRVLERFLTKHGCQLVSEVKPELATALIALVDAGSKPPKGVEPANVFTFGSAGKGDKSNHIPLPLTIESLQIAFGSFLTAPAPVVAHTSAASPAHPAHDSSEVAAEVATRIFRRLLGSPAAPRQSLKQTTQIVQDELKQIAAKLGWDA